MYLLSIFSLFFTKFLELTNCITLITILFCQSTKISQQVSNLTSNQKRKKNDLTYLGATKECMMLNVLLLCDRRTPFVIEAIH